MSEVLRRRPGLRLGRSWTTRPPRGREVPEGKYVHVSREAFLAARERGEFLEWAEVYGELYGTPRREVEGALEEGEEVLLELDVQGALQVKQALPGAVLVFLAPPSIGELAERLRGRGTENEASLSRRLEAARWEMEMAREFDHVVVNRRVEEAVQEVLKILEAEGLPGKGRPHA